MFALILEQLLFTLSAPLFAAVAKPKAKSVKKAVKKNRPAAASRKTLAAKKSAPPKADKSPRGAVKKNVKSARDKKSAGRDHGEPTPAATRQVVEPEPALKPIPPSGRAILLSPENEKFSDTLHPTFRWLSVGNATRYEVAWSEQPDLSQAYSVVSIATEAAVPVEKPLHLGTTYYWRVRGGNEGGWGPWSSTVSFRVLDEAA